MARCCRLASSIPLICCIALLFSLSSSAWKDPSPHHTRFVDVGNNLRLEVLDWGGSGRPLVLLAGGGDTAHVFDDFAPKLASHFHVYGITRRGFGASGYSAAEYGADRLGNDVLAVINALKLDRPVLLGHSIAGEEMSSVATRYPDRIAGLIYLEAAYPYAFDNGQGPAMKDFEALHGPQPPAPSATDLASFNSLRKYFKRVNGFTFPEAELRQQWESAADGRVLKQRDFPGYATLMMGMRNYSHIPVPVLAIFANPHSQGSWVDNNKDPSLRRAATTYSAALAVLTRRQERAVDTGIPGARVITLPNANHYIYLSNEAEVLREMRRFLAHLPR